MAVLQSDWLVLPGGNLKQGPFLIEVEGERIAAVNVQTEDTPTQDHDVIHAHLVTPGFIDIHTHGVGGSDDLVTYWLNPEYTQQVFARQGTTSFLATVVFPKNSPTTGSVLSRLRECVGRRREGGGAVLEGVHAEGPIVNDLGGLPPSDTAMPLGEFQLFIDSIPSLKMMTISPHLEAKNGYQRMQALLQRGVLPALGHDRAATESDILGALLLDPTKRMHITHLFNVCSFHHRSPSLVNFGLMEQFPSLPTYNGLLPPTIELIGDLAHVHPLSLSAAVKARSLENVCFVTDSALESKPGATVNYMGRQIQVSPDGRALRMVGEGVLAGSCCSMIDTLHNLVRVLGVPLGEAVAMLSENPARIIGLEHTGRIEVGRRADLLVFDKELNLQQTIIAGITEFKNE